MGDTETDPSLPLQDESLANLFNSDPEQSNAVIDQEESFRNDEECEELSHLMTESASVRQADATDLNHPHIDSTWQVDGSNHSVVSNRSMGDRMQGLTMRDYEEQLCSLRKENFNLKLRIYFMEENKGLLHGPVDQENLYRINIDLKVEGEELRKELEDKKALLAEAAKAIQTLEDKYRKQVTNLEEELAEEKIEKKSSKDKIKDMENKLREFEVRMADQTTGKGLSEESRFLYNEAFGSFSIGQKVDQGTETTAFTSPDQDIEITKLKSNLAEKEAVISNLEASESSQSKRLDDMESERKRLVDQLSQKDLELKSSEEISENSKNKIQQLSEDLSRKNQESEILEAKLDALTFQLQEQMGNTTEQVKLKNQVNDLETQCSNYVVQIEELRNILEQVRGEYAELAKENTLHEQRVKDCNSKVSDLESELRKRNEEVRSFLGLLRGMKKKKSADNLINNDVIDLDEGEDSVQSGESSSADLRLDDVILESKAILSELLHDSDAGQSDADKHLEYALSRNEELESALKELQADLDDRANNVIDLESQLKNQESERKAEEKRMKAKVRSLEETLRITDSNLKKAHICIQGFVQENEDLSRKLQTDCPQETLEKKTKEKFILLGIDRAARKFEAALHGYRSRYDRLRNHLHQRNSVCEMLRQRMEELAHFLSQLLESGDDTLNMSTLSADLRESIQNSIEQSLILSASVLHSNSVIQEETINDEDDFDDVWTVPVVSPGESDIEERDSAQKADFIVAQTNKPGRRHSDGLVIKASINEKDINTSLPSVLHGAKHSVDPGQSASQDRTAAATNTVTQQHEARSKPTEVEYETLLIDLRDSLRKRREAEEALEAKQAELESTKKELELAEVEIRSLKSVRGLDESHKSFVFAKPHSPAPASVDDSRSGRSLLSKLSASTLQKTKIQEPRRCSASVCENPHESGARKDQKRSSSLPRPKLDISKGSDGVVETGKRKTVSRIPILAARADDDEDTYSEPDKEESRRRMGIVCLEKETSNSNRQRFYAASEEEGSWERTRIEKLKKDKESLREETGMLEQEKKLLETRLTKVQGNLDTAEQIIRELSGEMKTLQARNSELEDRERRSSLVQSEPEGERSRGSSVRSSGSGQMTRLDVDGDRSEEENQNRINELELQTQGQSFALSDLKCQLETKEKNFKKEKYEFTRIHKDLESQLAAANAMVERITLDKDQVQSANKELEQALLRKSKKIEELKTERTEIGRTLTNMRNQVVSLEETKLMQESLKQEYDRLLSEKNQWTTERLEFQINLDKLEDKVAELQSCKKSLEASEQKFSKLYEEVKESRAQIVDLEKKCAAVRDEKSKCLAEISSVSKKLHDVESKFVRLENSKIVADSLSAEYKEKCISLSSRCDDYEQRLNSLKIELKVSESTSRKHQSELVRSNEQVEHLKEEMETRIEAESSAKLSMAEARHSLKQMEEQVELMKAEKRRLEEINVDISRTQESYRRGESKFHVEQDLLSKENFSKQEFEMALKKLSTSSSSSRPGSLRRALTPLDPNITGKENTGQKTSIDKSWMYGGSVKPVLKLGKLDAKPDGEELCCSAQVELQLARSERDEALKKLRSTEEALRDASDKISLSNQRKKKVERAIVEQLTKTRTVLKKAQNNLENCSGES